MLAVDDWIFNIKQIKILTNHNLWIMTHISVMVIPNILTCQASQANMVVDYKDWQIPLGRRFRCAIKLLPQCLFLHRLFSQIKKIWKTFENASSHKFLYCTAMHHIPEVQFNHTENATSQITETVDGTAVIWFGKSTVLHQKSYQLG